MTDSPYSVSGLCQEIDFDRSVNRKLWRYENGGDDASFKNKLFSGETSTPRSVVKNPDHKSDYANGVSRFLQRTATPSPQGIDSICDSCFITRSSIL
ncbi:hypothetical protein L1987_44062 [Smallanthus sonchifolius]|uniref:Uncharacterized protein n=1 Tax=Smallanthus sonchifolius TaxID=185202 RepID=A0ACB9GND1_9ASTR|nr:hypothetical protein L1987_44062 [Smallanthus sonchifolius]